MNFGDLPNPDHWIDIVDHFILAIFALLIAVIPTWMTIRGNKGIKDIKSQVINGHKDAPPLRADLDKAIKAISDLSGEVAGFRESISRDVESLRRALSDEEDRRRNHISEIRSDYDRRITDIHKRLDT